MCEGSRFEFGLLSLEAGTSNTSRLLWCDGLVVPFVSFCRTFVARSGQPQVVQPRSFLGCHHGSSLPRSHWKFCQAVPRIPNINIHKYTQISFLKDPQRLWLLQRKQKAMDRISYSSRSATCSHQNLLGPSGPAWGRWKTFVQKGSGVDAFDWRPQCEALWPEFLQKFS